MKKFNILLLGLLTVMGSLLMTSPVKAADPVVDQEFVPNFNNYGRYNSVFQTACTRFKPTKTTYATYFDLAVKSDRGADYPIRASFRSAVSDTIPGESILKYYNQTTFKNYAMSEGFSRFTAEDGKTITMNTSSNYFICIEQLWNDNATGWFYTNPASGKYSILGFPTDVPTYLDNVSFGFRTYGYNAETQSTPTTTVNGSNGSAPSTSTSSSISAPTGIGALYSATSKGISVTWSASKTIDITGYNVYRTTTTGKNYAKVGTAAKGVLQFVDGTVERNATYYYMIRAYKTTTESANSSEGSVTVPADAVIVPAVTSTPSGTVASTSDGSSGAILVMTPLTWSLLGLAVLLLGLLVYLICKRHKDSKKQAKKV